MKTIEKKLTSLQILDNVVIDLKTNNKRLTDSQILQKLVVGLKTLKPYQFKYNKFITSYKYDENDNICGTVCCAWGLGT